MICFVCGQLCSGKTLYSKTLTHISDCVFIEVGDIVLYSNRGDSIGSDSSKERGDILAKYNQDIHRDLKRMPGINPKLFLQMERIDKHSILKEERIDEGFEFDAQSDASDSDAEEREKREVAKKEEEQKRSDARDSKYTIVENDDINIDDI
jgi:hypothetical protein